MPDDHFQFHALVWRGTADSLTEAAQAMQSAAEWGSYRPLAAAALLATFVAEGYETVAAKMAANVPAADPPGDGP